MFLLRQSRVYGLLFCILSLFVLSSTAWEGWPPPDNAYNRPCEVPPDFNHPLPDDVIDCINNGTQMFCQPTDGQRICLHSKFTINWTPQTFKESETTNIIISLWNKQPILPLTEDELGIARLYGVSLYQGTCNWTLYDDSPWDNIQPGDGDTPLTFYAVLLDDFDNSQSTVRGPSITVIPPVARDKPLWTGTPMVTTLSPTSFGAYEAPVISSTMFTTSRTTSDYPATPTSSGYATLNPTQSCYYGFHSGTKECKTGSDSSPSQGNGNTDPRTTITIAVCTVVGIIILFFVVLLLCVYLSKRNLLSRDTERQQTSPNMLESRSASQVGVYRPPQDDTDDGENELPPYMESRDNVANPPAYESRQVWDGDHRQTV